jgi:AraC-like DNA-binding protein
METPLLTHTTPLIDLSGVEAGRRPELWAATARSCFPGLSVNDMPSEAPVGEIRSIGMGGGALWSILSAPIAVSYAPAGGAEDPRASISLLMQLEGSMLVAQARRTCELGSGDMCLLDERFPFHLQGREQSHIVFLRMPRRAVLGRHPWLEHHTAGAIAGEDAGAALLRDTLVRTLETVGDLRETQRSAVLSAMIQLLGAASTAPAAPAPDAGWRVRAALAYIEMHLADGELTPEEVARDQGVSRRRLDQILREALGLSVAGRIWERRLQQAAADLVDPGRASLAVSQIGFSVGFEDAAHFSRAFKKRFGRTPSEWRSLGASRMN